MASILNQAELKELNKAVHAKNEKLRYYEAYKGIVMPDKTSYATLKNAISSKEEYDQIINSLRSFGKQKIPEPIVIGHGVKLHPQVYTDIVEKVGRINAQRADQKSKYESMMAKSRGEDLGYNVGMMKSVKMNEFSPKVLNFDRFRSKYEMKLYLQSINRMSDPLYYQKADENLKMNYIRHLYNTFGLQANKIIKKIQDMPTDEVVKIIYTDSEASIKFLASEQFDNGNHFDVIATVWGVDTGDNDEIEI